MSTVYTDAVMRHHVAGVLFRANYSLSPVESVLIRERYAALRGAAELKRRTAYEQLATVYTRDQLYNAVADVRAEGGDITPFVLAEDVLAVAPRVGGERQDPPPTTTKSDDGERERERQARFDKQQRRQAEADAERKRQEAADLEFAKTLQVDELPPAFVVQLDRVTATVVAMPEASIGDVLAAMLDVGSQGTATNEAAKEVVDKYTGPLMDSLYRAAVARVVPRDTRDLLLAMMEYATKRDWAEFYRHSNDFQSLIKRTKREQQPLPPPPRPTLGRVTVGGLEVRRDELQRHMARRPAMTLNNFVYDSNSCPFESALTALFKRHDTPWMARVLAAQVFQAPAGVNAAQLHYGVLQAIEYLHGLDNAPALQTKTVDQMNRLREQFAPMLVGREHYTDTYDARTDVLVPLLDFYGVRYHVEGVNVNDEWNGTRGAGEELVMFTLQGLPEGVAMGAVDFETQISRFDGAELELVACLSFRHGPHWFSYVRDGDGDWYHFDGWQRIQERSENAPGSRYPLGVTRGYSVGDGTKQRAPQQPHAWIFRRAPGGGPAPTNDPLPQLLDEPVARAHPLPVVGAILENVEHDERYSSPERGLHYDAIQSDLLPVLADAYNRNADTIAASPRLAEALAPLTANGGELELGSDVASQTRYLHWLSVAAHVLNDVDRGHPVDEFVRERCFAERPQRFLQ